jgi:hypothetical protein
MFNTIGPELNRIGKATYVLVQVPVHVPDWAAVRTGEIAPKEAEKPGVMPDNGFTARGFKALKPNRERLPNGLLSPKPKPPKLKAGLLKVKVELPNPKIGLKELLPNCVKVPKRLSNPKALKLGGENRTRGFDAAAAFILLLGQNT